jgi:hypothetical protein
MAALFDNVPKLTREAVLKAVGSIAGGRRTDAVLDRLKSDGYDPDRRALWVTLGRMERDGELTSRRKGRWAYWRRAEG